MGIDLRGGDIRMAEHHLYGTKIRSPFQKMAGKRVTKKVRSNPLAKTGPSRIVFQIFPEALSAHPFARAVDEKGGIFLSFRKNSTSCFQIDSDPIDRFASEWNDPFLGSLSI
jgi:hypothetical protein